MMALKRGLEENPYAAPLEEDYLRTAWQYRDHFEDEAEFQDALELWPRCPRCGRRRVTRCPVCKTSGDLFPLADQEYYDPSLQTSPIATDACDHCRRVACAEHDHCDDDSVVDVETVDSHERRRLEQRHVWAELGQPCERSKDNSDSRAPALLCHVCSEAFTPVFPRYCEWCDYDFGEGEEYEIDGAVSKEVEDFLERKAREEDAAFEADPDRVLWTLVAAAALALFLVLWFIIL